jgi:hypothetical protein
MRKLVFSGLSGLVLLSLVVVGGAGAQPLAQPARVKILTFQTMLGVEGPFLGEANAIRGIAGDELPWEIVGSARGALDTTGHLTLQVRGLVFADDPSVPRPLIGKNDEAEFRAVVSCLTVEGGTVLTVNVTTAGFAATVSGDSDIDTTIELPAPCVAPIIFVIAGSEDKWFSVTGFESEAE